VMVKLISPTPRVLAESFFVSRHRPLDVAQFIRLSPPVVTLSFVYLPIRVA